jgi:hypothetical protein
MKRERVSTKIFIAYVEYRAYMERHYPGCALLSYRDWLDFGSRP